MKKTNKKQTNIQIKNTKVMFCCQQYDVKGTALLIINRSSLMNESTNLLNCAESELMKRWPIFSDSELSGCLSSSQS